MAIGPIADGLQVRTADHLFKGKKVALFAAPGKVEVSGGETLLGQL